MLPRKHYTLLSLAVFFFSAPGPFSSSHSCPGTEFSSTADSGRRLHWYGPTHRRDPALRFQFKHENEVRGIAFASKQSRLVTLGCDITLYSWNLELGAEEYKIVLNPGGALESVD